MRGFVLREALGEGGFAQVFAAERESDASASMRAVAVKIGRRDTPVLRERFRREAEAMRLVGPPHTPAIYESGELDDGRPFLAMERLFGETLADRLAGMLEPPGVEQAAAIGAAVLSAIAAAHERGVIHRDLKPENIFFPSGERDDEGERAVLLDFGLTKAAAEPSDRDAGLTRTGVIVGTASYMAPEQIRADPSVGVPADIYAFGVILFEILTLRLPFLRDVEHGHLALRPPRPSEIDPAAAPLDELVLACLSKDPARRPADAAELRRALMAIVTDGSAQQSSPANAGAAAPRGKMIADGRQPVVVLAAESKSAAAPIIAAIAEHGGLVVRQRGSRYVSVFSGMDVNDPAQAALSAARDLADRFGARAALHLDNVTLRRKDRKQPTVYGACVDRPETWMPADPWSGIMLTAELARVVPESELAAPKAATMAAPVLAASAPAKTDPSMEIEIPLLGRADVIAAIEASASSALRGGSPGLFTLLGEHGLGKSRLAGEAATAATRAHPDAQVIALKASPNASAGAAREVTDLLRRALDAPSSRPEDVQAFCVDRLGKELGAEVAPSVAAALGWSEGEPAAIAPATFHHGIVRALAEALRRQARRAPVAVILDDAHWADDAVLDALEYATLDGASCPLWVAIAAHPRFEQARRSWGSRTQSHARQALAPLDEAAATELAARLLLPAEYPPAATLKRLADWSGGNPFSLREIIRDLKRSGIVRRRTYAGTYYVATAELDNLPPSPAWQWLAARQLSALPAELAAFVRLCAVLGVSFSRTELERVQDAIDRAGDAGTPVDVGYGLSTLVDRKILKREEGERFSFQNALFQDAIYEMLDPTQRERAHRRAFEAWRAEVGEESQEVDALSRLARHAGACGERETAAEAYLKLGDLAFAKHRALEADQHYTSALAFLEESDAKRRAHALLGRGKCRYRIHRPREASNDLSAARELVRGQNKEALLAEILLEEATALDWASEFDASAKRVQEAAMLVDRIDDPRLHARQLTALGRTCLRQVRVSEALDLLTQAATRAMSVGDYETRITALVLLAFELACAGRLEEAETRFEEAIHLATEVEDWTHLCAARTNRIVLWAEKKAFHLAVDDLERVIALAREIGNPFIECTASFNAALLLFLSDQEDEAVQLARRAYTLAQRFIERASSEYPLLVARILTARGEYEEAARLTGWVVRSCLPEPSAQPGYSLTRALQLIFSQLHVTAGEPGESPEGWDDIVDRARGAVLGIDLLELLYWRARLSLWGGRLAEASVTLESASSLIEEWPMWRRRFTELQASLAEVQAGAIST